MKKTILTFVSVFISILNCNLNNLVEDDSKLNYFLKNSKTESADLSFGLASRAASSSNSGVEVYVPPISSASNATSSTNIPSSSLLNSVTEDDIKIIDSIQLLSNRPSNIQEPSINVPAVGIRGMRDITIRLKGSATKDDATGIYHYIVEVSRGSLKKDIVVSYQFLNNNDYDRILISKISSSDIEKIDGISPNINTLPSSVPNPTFSTGGSIGDLSGYTVRLIGSVVKDNNTGIYSYKVEVSKGSFKSSELSVIYNSFKSLNQNMIARLRSLLPSISANDFKSIDKIQVSSSHLPSDLGNPDFSDSRTVNKLSNFDIQLDNSYSTNPNKNDNIGVYEYYVSVSKNVNGISIGPKTITVTYSGFKNSTANALSGITESLIKSKDGIVASSATLPSELSNPVFQPIIIHGIVFNLELDGNVVKNDTLGRYLYSVNVKKSGENSVLSNKRITYTGLDTTIKRQNRQDRINIAKFTESDIKSMDNVAVRSSSLASNVRSINFTVPTLKHGLSGFVVQLDTGRSPNIVSNDSTGALSYYVLVKKGSLSKAITINYSGFQTSAAAALASDQSFLSSVTSSDIKSRDGISVLATKLPSEMSNPVFNTSSNLRGLSNYTIELESGTLNKDNITGEYKYKVKIKSNNSSALVNNINVSYSGFEKQSQRDEIRNALHSITPSDMKAMDNIVNASTIYPTNLPANVTFNQAGGASATASDKVRLAGKIVKLGGNLIISLVGSVEQDDRLGRYKYKVKIEDARQLYNHQVEVLYTCKVRSFSLSHEISNKYEHKFTISGLSSSFSPSEYNLNFYKTSTSVGKLLETFDSASSGNLLYEIKPLWNTAIRAGYIGVEAKNQIFRTSRHSDKLSVDWGKMNRRIKKKTFPTSGKLGESMVISGDGNTLAISSTGINKDDNKVLIYKKSGTSWSYLTAISPSRALNTFTVSSMDISNDGSVIVIGNPRNSNQSALNLLNDGAVDAHHFGSSGRRWIIKNNHLITIFGHHRNGATFEYPPGTSNSKDYILSDCVSYPTSGLLSNVSLSKCKLNLRNNGYIYDANSEYSGAIEIYKKSSTSNAYILEQAIKELDASKNDKYGHYKIDLSKDGRGLVSVSSKYSLVPVFLSNHLIHRTVAEIRDHHLYMTYGHLWNGSNWFYNGTKYRLQECIYVTNVPNFRRSISVKKCKIYQSVLKSRLMVSDKVGNYFLTTKIDFDGGILTGASFGSSKDDIYVTGITQFTKSGVTRTHVVVWYYKRKNGIWTKKTGGIYDYLPTKLDIENQTIFSKYQVPNILANNSEVFIGMPFSNAVKIFKFGSHGSISSPKYFQGEGGYGYSLSLGNSGKTLIVGAPNEFRMGTGVNPNLHGVGSNVGAAYVSTRSASTSNDWSTASDYSVNRPYGYLKPPISINHAYFGSSVVITPNGDQAIGVSRSNAFYIY